MIVIADFVVTIVNTQQPDTRWRCSEVLAAPEQVLKRTMDKTERGRDLEKMIDHNHVVWRLDNRHCVGPKKRVRQMDKTDGHTWTRGAWQ